MPPNGVSLPPEVRRFSGLYSFIPPDRYEELGIDAEDVPIGTIPAENHPPFLPDRFGGNAYGLGLFEQTVLPAEDGSLVDTMDFDNPASVARHHKRLNELFKRLGLLVRYSSRGRPFYLIPRQFVAHFLVEVQAQADEIYEFLRELLVRRLRETMRVGLVTTDSELLLPELQRRMPYLDFTVLESLEDLTAHRQPLEALVVVSDPCEFVWDELRARPADAGERDDYEDAGHFAASRLYDLLEEDGELMVVAEHPLEGDRQPMTVRFADQDELKRFLLFSHIYRTRRRYKTPKHDMELKIARRDFNAFLTGLGLYHEMVESLLDGRSLRQVGSAEIDRLPRQDLPLPRGSVRRLMSGWRRWLEPYFSLERLEPCLPAAQRGQWRSRYEVDGEFPPTLVVAQGRRRRPGVTLGRLERQATWRHMAGCRRELLAQYKDSFAYVHRVLAILGKVKRGSLESLPGLELSRLRKPFESSRRHQQLKNVLRLMELAPKLKRLERRFNPRGALGGRTPMLANLEKLALLGVEAGCLDQIYLMVLGHSTMTRVTFGKLPETSLAPLTDLGRYADLDEAVSVLRLYRLLSVAEAAAASPQRGLSPRQVEELFNLYDQAIRVVTDPLLDWNDILDEQITQVGGAQAKAMRKMLKLFNYFDHIDDWQRLAAAGPRVKEAMADFDQAKLGRIQEVVALDKQLKRFVGAFYAEGSTARPYFFRALLNCELHGTGRLLPALGAEAGFILLWIGVHTSEERLIDFNQLMRVDDERELPQRLGKLRRALMALKPRALDPQWLARRRRDLARGRTAYVHDSGLYLNLDQRTRALTPVFLDPQEELIRLGRDLGSIEGKPLSQVPPARLAAVDRRGDEVGRFLRAQESIGLSPSLADMAESHRRLERRLENHLLTRLFNLPEFAANLRRVLDLCPHFAGRILPEPAGHPRTQRRLAAATKLSSVHLRRMEQFQDMELSHQLAQQEFGPAAAGVVGVSRAQFQALAASLSQLVKSQNWLGRLLMLGVLLYEEGGAPCRAKGLPPLAHRVEFSLSRRDDLAFLLEHVDLLRQVVSGEACLSGLQPLLDRQDPPLVETLFLLSVICTAARREGVLTEDLLERFLNLLTKLRQLSRKGKTANEAHWQSLEGFARQLLAFEHYKDIQDGEAPTASLRQLLETVELPEAERQRWLTKGQGLAALDRLLKLRELLLVDGLDVLMLEHEVPPAYIYRLKNLRSEGATHFERDLFEGLRLLRGLYGLPKEVQRTLQESLSDPARPVRLVGFAQAARLLTYANQIRLVLVGLAGAARLREQAGDNEPVTVSFLPLARVIERKFELINEAVTNIDPLALVKRRAVLAGLMRSHQGLSVGLDVEARVVSLDIADPANLDRKIEAVRRASTPEKLKRLYHRELRKFNLTAYRSLDFQERLEAAFRENLDRLGREMVERVRAAMAAEDSLAKLEALFDQAWEEGLELPLGPNRQQSLRDLWEMNAERVRTSLLDSVNRRLAQAKNARDLVDLWQEVRQRLQEDRRHLGKDYILMVAERFDRRAAELGRRDIAAL